MAVLITCTSFVESWRANQASQQNKWNYTDWGSRARAGCGERSSPPFSVGLNVVFAPAGGLLVPALPALLLPSPSQHSLGCPRSRSEWILALAPTAAPAAGLQPEPLLLPSPACLGKTRPGSICREWKHLFVGYRKQLQAQGLEQPGKWVLLSGAGAEYSVGLGVAKEHACSHSGMGCRNSQP